MVVLLLHLETRLNARGYHEVILLHWISLYSFERDTKNPAVNNLQILTLTDLDYLIITGDLNIHIDNPKNKTAKEFSGLFETFDWSSMWKGSHWIWLLARVLIFLPLLSGMWASQTIFVFSLISQFLSEKKYINEHTICLFMEAMSVSVSLTSDSVFDCKTLKAIDAIAPKKLKTSLARRKHRGEAP